MPHRLVMILVSMILLVAGPVRADGTAGRLVAVSGQVWTTAPGAAEVRARVGSQLAAGSLVRTGADGRAEIVAEDGSTIVVQSATAMRLSGVKRQQKKTSVLIFFGRIWNKVSRAVGDEASYDVNTPVAVAGVRGTEFETAVGEDGSVRVRVSEGRVAVAGDAGAVDLEPDQEIDLDIDGRGRVAATDEGVDWQRWAGDRREHLRRDGRRIVDGMTDRIAARKTALESLRSRQVEVTARRDAALERVAAGDPAAVEEVRRYNAELVKTADEIADIGDSAGAQFGIVEHFGVLATDPGFRMADGRYVAAEADRVQRIRAQFDEMVAEGTDISLEAMEKMLREMSDGRRGSLKFKKGSSADDLWGDKPGNSKP